MDFSIASCAAPCPAAIRLCGSRAAAADCTCFFWNSRACSSPSNCFLRIRAVLSIAVLMTLSASAAFALYSSIACSGVIIFAIFVMSPKAFIAGFAEVVDDLEDGASPDSIRGAERLRAGRLRAGEVPTGAAAAFLAMISAPVRLDADKTLEMKPPDGRYVKLDEPATSCSPPLRC